MGGIFGLILGKKRRSAEDRDILKRIFVRLLLANDVPYPHDTGVVAVRTDGEFRIHKKALRVGKFANEKGFKEVMAFVDDQTTVLMGQVRRRMPGDPKTVKSIRPMVTSGVIGTHRGEIFNAKELFERYRLPRETKTDSEVLLQMAAHSTEKGRINPETFLDDLRPCHGTISLSMVSLEDPGSIFLLNGAFKYMGKAIHLHHRAFFYASGERPCLGAVLLGEPLWHAVNGWPMKLCVYMHEDVRYPWMRSFIEFETVPERGWRGWIEANAPEERERQAAERAKRKGPLVLKPIPQKWRGAGCKIIIEH